MATTKRKTTKTASKRTAAAASSGPDLATIGRYVFLGGAALAVIAGILFAMPSFYAASIQSVVVYLLTALALVGGWLHISKESQNGFFILALALHTFSSTLGFLPTVGSYITSVLGALAMFVVIAAISVAVRTVVDWFRS